MNQPCSGGGDAYRRCNGIVRFSGHLHPAAGESKHPDVHGCDLGFWGSADSKLLGQSELNRGRAEVTGGLLNTGGKRRSNRKRPQAVRSGYGDVLTFSIAESRLAYSASPRKGGLGLFSPSRRFAQRVDLACTGISQRRHRLRCCWGHRRHCTAHAACFRTASRISASARSQSSTSRPSIRLPSS
jgi:hypothetical protein